MKEYNQDEMNQLTRIYKINIFIKILSVKEFNHDEMNQLAQITKINIFIKIFISERVQLWWGELLDTNY